MLFSIMIYLKMLLYFPVLYSRTFFFFFFFFFRAAPAAYGGSQARGRIGAAAVGLHHSHSNSGSEPRLGTTPKLTATPDP